MRLPGQGGRHPRRGAPLRRVPRGHLLWPRVCGGGLAGGGAQGGVSRVEAPRRRGRCAIRCARRGRGARPGGAAGPSPVGGHVGQGGRHAGTVGAVVLASGRRGRGRCGGPATDRGGAPRRPGDGGEAAGAGRRVCAPPVGGVGGRVGGGGASPRGGRHPGGRAGAPAAGFGAAGGL
ncbi:hypothetical protein BU14_1716s0002 [Porphyra umbilicalis]|uniref:Uncharacterized protein n=1 Tax=Porphyra umbilicalis TaxID=2786 RepID=A0A1X6NL31_PORUM|nr:hypothetical protein BU14_1716s0002 [Porphyra umbilicalis]|eukprot:OSX69230.1 hypothetical protein BU14_1716s0002 [Porphyra umbilicalis]